MLDALLATALDLAALSPLKMSYLPGTTSLIEDINKKHWVLLRVLRSTDQFANLLLCRTVEHTLVGKKYGATPRGTFVVRGENVVL